MIGPHRVATACELMNAAASDRLKGPILDQITERFIKGAPLKLSGVRFQIVEDALEISLEVEEDLQKMFEGAANERLNQSGPVLAKLITASQQIRRAVAPLKQRYVLIERFSGRQICVRNGGVGDIEWKPGYPSNTNYNPDELVHSLEPVEHILGMREGLKAVATILLTFLAAACVGGATYLVCRSAMAEIAILTTVFAVVFFFHSLIGEGILRTLGAFILVAVLAWVAIRFIPAFSVDYAFDRQLTGEIVGFFIGFCTGKPLGHLYRKLE